MTDAVVLQEENARLKAQLQEKEAQLRSREQRILTLEELIKQFNRKQFSSSSEKLSRNQLDLGLFNEAESTEETEDTQAGAAEAEDLVEVPAHTRRKKPRVSLPPHLPREELWYELSAEERICPHDGTELKATGTEDHEQLEIVPAQAKVIVHRRQKYVCPCCEQHHVAPKPKQPIEKSIAAPGLLAYIATQKYCDALPLYRQSEIFKRIGLALDRTNLANWMIRCGHLVQPPDERYRRRQQDAKPVIDKLRIWLEKSLPQVPPQSAIGRALGYLHSQWDRLVRYLEDGQYPIDNNRAENAIRPFTVGRKNWLFANSQAGAKASANLYSLIETAKANGLNPYEYLKVAFKELPNAQSVEAIESLLPWNATLNPQPV